MNSREAFEQVVLANGGLVDRDGSGAYAERDVDISWLAWQAATERAAAVCQDEMDEQFCGLDPWFATRRCRDAIREGND